MCVTRHKRRGVRSINKELVLSELLRSREALDAAIAYVRADTAMSTTTTARARAIRAGEGRAVAILTGLRDAGGVLGQREFEETCLRNCRTLVGAGGFIARGSIVRELDDEGNAVYRLTEKGAETVNKWEARYGKNWAAGLEYSDMLSNASINDQQKVRILAS